MENSALTGSIRGLLDEYKRAINQLADSIRPLTKEQLFNVADNNTTDNDCKSIQTILTHVIFSGFIYTVEIEKSVGLNKYYPSKVDFEDAEQYIKQLNLMLDYCENFFKQNRNLIIEQTDNSKKIVSGWGQTYDIEQIMEHSIVHILRHRRQIDLFIKKQDLINDHI
ncbi:MAG: DinB family protein [Bacteroidota bacterium]